MNNVIEGQDKELFKKFIEFCDKQPKDKKIDHRSWERCAVGQFMREKDMPCTFENIKPILGVITDNVGINELCSKISRGICPNTYGEFTEFLRKYL